jgi:hypothetical protein
VDNGQDPQARPTGALLPQQVVGAGNVQEQRLLPAQPAAHPAPDLSQGPTTLVKKIPATRFRGRHYKGREGPDLRNQQLVQEALLLLVIGVTPAAGRVNVGHGVQVPKGAGALGLAAVAPRVGVERDGGPCQAAQQAQHHSATQDQAAQETAAECQTGVFGAMLHPALCVCGVPGAHLGPRSTSPSRQRRSPAPPRPG